MILVTDDDAITRLGISRLLRHHGYDVRTAASGHATMNFLSMLTPDAVVLDLRMPDIHGLDVLRAIRLAPALEQVPVVVFTSDDESRTAAIACGAQAFIVKGQVSWGAFVEQLGQFVRPDVVQCH